MSNRIFRAAFFAAAAGISSLSVCSGASAAIMIDEFNGTLNVNVGNLGPNPGVNNGGNSHASILGGARGVTATRLTGSNGMQATTDLGGNGLMSFSIGAADTGTVRLQYDADTVPGTLNATGLGGVNLLAGGNDTISLLYRSDLATNVTVHVYTDASNASTATLSLPGTGFGANPFVFGDLPFSSFTPLVGAGANFGSVGAIDILLNGVALTSALDMQIDSIQARVVPEPASLSLLGLAGLVLRRRR